MPVRFGVYVPQLVLSFDDILERARRCERLGFDRFWLYDHLHGPGLPDTPSLEGWTLATALLARTERLRVGHLVLCNNFRHPAVLARMATTLDIISGGRLEFGLGSGSDPREHLEAGLPYGTYAQRSARLGEALQIITSMFANPHTTFVGDHYTVTELPNIPGPVQQPGPPIHIGGAGRRTVSLAAQYADVWNVPTYALDRLPDTLARFEQECARYGRDPADVRRSVQGVVAVAPAPALPAALETARRRFGAAGFGLDAGGFVGTPAQVADRIGQLVDLGFSDFEFFIHDRGTEQTLGLLADEVTAHFA